MGATMRKITLGNLAIQNSRGATFMMRKKLYTFVDVAKEIMPTTYINSVTGREQQTTRTVYLYIIREIGKIDAYKVLPEEKYSDTTVVVL